MRWVERDILLIGSVLHHVRGLCAGFLTGELLRTLEDDSRSGLENSAVFTSVTQSLRPNYLRPRCHLVVAPELS